MSKSILLGLEKVLEEKGWGTPSRLFLIGGSEVEPTFTPLVDLDKHPCDVLQELWQAGVRVPDGTIGLALVMEGLRHLRFDELEEAAPVSYAGVYAAAVEEFGDNEGTELAMRMAWEDMCVTVPVEAMPEHMRVLTRNSIAVLTAGWSLMVVRDHGGEPVTLPPVSPNRIKEARVPDFLHMFLTGTEPVD